MDTPDLKHFSLAPPFDLAPAHASSEEPASYEEQRVFISKQLKLGWQECSDLRQLGLFWGSAYGTHMQTLVVELNTGQQFYTLWNNVWPTHTNWAPIKLSKSLQYCMDWLNSKESKVTVSPRIDRYSFFVCQDAQGALLAVFSTNRARSIGAPYEPLPGEIVNWRHNEGKRKL